MANGSPAPKRGQGAGPSGELPILDSLFREHYVFIVRRLARFGVPNADVDDVAQEVFLGAFRALPRFDRLRGKPRSWLYRIAFYRAIKFLSMARHHRETHRSREDLEAMVHGEPDPEQRTGQNHALRLAIELLETVDVRRRGVFIDYVIEGIPMVAIAKKWGIATTTGWGWLKQAKAALTLELKRRQRARRAHR